MKSIFLIVCLTICSCNSISNKTANAIKKDNFQLIEKIDSIFNNHIAENEPGAAILVSYQGEMLVGKGYGMRDIEGKHPITKSTNMRIASLTKQFTALTILKLIDDGKLSLKDSVHKFFPYESFETTQVAENKDILQWYSKENRKVTEPGEKYEYNNGVYELIPCLVEIVSGEDFSQFAKEEIFNNARMKNTNFFNLAHPININERAFCYEKNDSEKWQKIDGFYLNGLLGAGGIYTSIEDFFQYDKSLSNRDLFSDATHDLIFQPSSTYEVDGVARDYGMGWVLKDNTAYHSGSWLGTNTYTKRYFNIPVTLAIFMNRNTLFEDDLINSVDSVVINHIKNSR